MIANSVRTWAKRLVEAQALSEENRPDFEYGLTNILSALAYTLCAVVVAAFIGKVWNVLLFSACLMVLRQYTGGYHADSRKRCFLVSLAVQAMHIAVTLLPAWRTLHCGIMIVAIANIPITFSLAPVIHEKAPLSEIETAYHKLRSRQVIIIIVASSLTAYGLGAADLALSGLFACAVTAISLIMARRRSSKCC